MLAAMEEEGIVLNLHGEVPSSAADGVTVMNAEARFVPVLKDLVARFPRLKIVLEHVTSAEAVKALWEIDSELVKGTVTGKPRRDPALVSRARSTGGARHPSPAEQELIALRQLTICRCWWTIGQAMS